MISRQYDRDQFRRLSSLSKLMDDMLGESGEIRSGWVPSVDIKETDKEIAILAEVPGMKQEDIEVEMVGDMLTIRGQREMSSEEKKDNYVRIERNYGSFQRSFTLGVPVKADQITANYKDGILEIRVPKADEVQPRRINVSAS